jgi:membrane-bound lytic murein transglycosylase D
MVKHAWLPTLAAAGLALTAAACGSAGRQDRPALTPVAPEAMQAPAPEDPVAALIQQSDAHYREGQRELALGHLDRARQEFDRALDVLLSAPGGARTEPRLREQFDRLVDRISALELTALAKGDGFSEKPSEPASIDMLFALSDEEVAATEALTEAVESDLARTAHDIPIPLNARVLRYVELFQGRLRGFIQDGLDRGAQYLPMIQSVFRAEGLPLDLAYVPLIESAFKPNALSRASARGVWQFMRPTARENGLRHDWYVDERQDPEKSTHAAARYLKTLQSMFDGDWHLALAAYNGGPGRVRRAMKRSGLDDFWTLSGASRRYLPRETREYVPMILAAVIIARNPTQYGFTPPDPASAPAVETVTVTGPVDLRRVAEWIGQPVTAIEQLNPELRRWTTPLRSDGYVLRVPAGSASLLQARLDGTPPAERGALNWHTVKPGETMTTIARKLGVRRTDLAEANYMTIRSRLRAGQKLVVPRAPAVLMASRPDREAPASAGDRVERASLTTNGSRSDGTVRHVYRVRRGDTLSRIARLYHTTVAELKQWNRLRSNLINPGQRLTIYRPSPSSD